MALPALCFVGGNCEIGCVNNRIVSFSKLHITQVITWFQNRRAKLKRDMEELKKDVETVKVLSVHKSFLENVNDLGILKKKPVHEEAAPCSPQK